MRLIDANSLSKCNKAIYKAKIVFDIPENATNGDMIKAIFPNAKIHQSGGYIGCLFQQGVMLEDKTSDWWNAPYNLQQNLSYTDRSGANIASQDVLRSAT